MYDDCYCRMFGMDVSYYTIFACIPIFFIILGVTWAAFGPEHDDTPEGIKMCGGYIPEYIEYNEKYSNNVILKIECSDIKWEGDI